MPLLYPDAARTAGAPESDLAELARRICLKDVSELDLQRLGPRAYSVADQFELLALTVSELMAGQPVTFPRRTSGLLGPDAAPPPSSTIRNLDWFAFRDATKDVVSFMRTEHRVPARVFIGAEPIPPALIPQVPIIMAALAAVGVDVLGLEDYEAEDIVASLASKVKPPIEIASGDRDLFSLVREREIIVRSGSEALAVCVCRLHLCPPR